MEQELDLGWAEMVHPEDQAMCLESYAKAFDRREPFGIEHRLRRADGEYRWIRDDGSPRHDIQGGFLGYIDHCHDVTERRLAEQRLRRAVEVAQMVLWGLDCVTGRLGCRAWVWVRGTDRTPWRLGSRVSIRTAAPDSWIASTGLGGRGATPSIASTGSGRHLE